MLIGLAATLLFALVAGLAAVLQAQTVRGLPRPETAGLRTAVRTALTSRRLLAVIALYLASWLLHVVSIDRLPLFLSQAGVAASLAITALGAAYWLGEHLIPRHLLAIGAVVVGLAMLVAAAGPVSTAPFGALGNTLLLVGALLIGVSGIWMAHRPGHGLSLALLGGLAFAGSPLATRAMVDASGLDWLIPGATVPVYGALGFWLYSVAMQRTSVAAASTVLVAAQVVVPAVVGVLVLGDGLDPTWWWLVAPGLLLAVGGGAVVEQRAAAPS